MVNLFSILDTKASIYMQPFCCSTNAVALRHFSDSVNTADSPFHKHPEDYILFEIGRFDDQTGEIISNPSPTSVAKAIDLINPEF